MKHQVLQALVFAVSLLAASPHVLAGDGVPGRSQAPAPLEGTWNVAIRPFNCATGQVVPGVVFRSRLAFHAGGTMTETTSNALFEPGQRSIGLGDWARTGRTSYHAVFEAYILFDSHGTTPPFYQRGTQRVDQGIEMIDDDHWRSTASVVFRNEANDIVPPTGCMVAEAERLQ